jgi:MFS family permease
MEDYKPILKNKNFLYLWISQILSQLTINIVNFLILIKIYSDTHSSIATSLLWVAYALPAILIGPFAATSVDMLNKKKLLVFTNLLQSVTVFSYILFSNSSVFLLYGIAVVYSFLNQFYVPAEQSTLPSVVQKAAYPLANGLFIITQQGALVVGFGVAGLLLQLLGFEYSILLCSGFLFLAFISVLFLPEMKTKDFIPEDLGDAVLKFFDRIAEGYSYIKDHRYVLTPFLLLLSLQVALVIVMVNVPIFSTEILNINVNQAGALIVVPAGIGAAMGALTFPKALKRGLRKKVVVENSMLIMSLSLLLFSFLIPMMFGLYRVVTAMFVAAALGFGFIGITVPAQTFLQEKTPLGLRGRVFGNYGFLAIVVTIFPVIITGTITELFGPKFLIFTLFVLSLTGLIIIKKYGEEFLRNGS